MTAVHSNESDGLPTQLWRLANFTRIRTKEAKSQGELVETAETFVRRSIKKFQCMD
jgi:hypothetical protein